MASTRTAPSTDGATSVSARDGGRREPAPSAASRRERQKDEFGGFSWLSTLAGWLSAAGLTAILTGILSAAGAALALNQVGSKVTGSEAKTIGLAGGIALLVMLAIGYFFGGYVAGRMARFDGARQGIGVWLWGILIALIASLAVTLGAAILGGKTGERFHKKVDRLN